MNKKYFNNAMIGNQNITVSFNKYGELLRMYYPLPDYMQYSDFFYTGVKINDSNIIYLHDDPNNRYNQYYTEDTNILNTQIENTYFKLKIKQTDAVMIHQDVIFKKYEFTNENSIDLNLNFLIHSKVFSSFNNMAGAKIMNDALVQYSHNYTFSIFSKGKLLSHQLNNCINTISSGSINDKDYIGMASDAAISFDLGVIKPGEKKTFPIFIYLTYENESMNDIEEEIEKIRRKSIDKEINAIEKYWRKYVEKHNINKIQKDGTQNQDQLNKVYKRTILYLPLLVNEKTGGIAASLEIDEQRDACGRYSYCWPRDAVVISQCLDMLGNFEQTKKFYEVFLQKTQSKNGMWEQRFYTDGRLAPCWGYQIDETASVIYGVLQHYKLEEKYTGKQNKKFLKDNLKMCEKAAGFLGKYLNHLLGRKETEDVVRMELEKTYHYEDRDQIYKHPSYDLWEMNEGVHLYSLSSIYCAFSSLIQIYAEIKDVYENNRLKIDYILNAEKQMEKYMIDIKKYIMDNLYDKDRKVLLRNTKDKLTDISVLAAVCPFGVFKPNEKIVQNTVEQINMTLRTYTGGYLRFQNDSYIGGNNPWVIATAWMGLYYKQAGKKKEAEECLNFILKTANEHGLLSEQIDNETLEAKWVIGLGWSHAMFILLLNS